MTRETTLMTWLRPDGSRSVQVALTNSTVASTPVHRGASSTFGNKGLDHETFFPERERYVLVERSGREYNRIGYRAYLKHPALREST